MPACRGALEHRPRRRPAAEQNGVEFGQRRGGLGVRQRLGQLVGDQRRIASARSRVVYRRWQFGDVEARRHVDLDRHRAGLQHCAPGPGSRRCDGSAARAARCRARRDGHEWPTRWRSARPGSASPPWGFRWCPTSATTSATSSSISSPTRNDGGQQLTFPEVRRPGWEPGERHGRRAAPRGRPAATAPKARAGWRALAGWLFGVLGVARVVQRPAVGGELGPHPLDSSGAGQFVGDLR